MTSTKNWKTFHWPVEAALDLVGGKWKLRILSAIAGQIPSWTPQSLIAYPQPPRYMDSIISRIRKDLTSGADPKTQQTFQRFFKEEIQYYGVKVPVVNKIANRYWKEIKSRDKQEIFALCEELYQSGYCEEAFVVSTWVPKLAGQVRTSRHCGVPVLDRHIHHQLGDMRRILQPHDGRLH